MINRKFILASLFGLSGGILAVACGNSGATTTAATGDAGGNGPSGPSTVGNGGSMSTTNTTGVGGSVGATNGTGGTTVTTTAGNGGSTNATTTSSTTGAGGGPECDKVTTLHPPQADAGLAQIYCPFALGPDGGKANVYCDIGTQHCCEGVASPTPSECNPIATPCSPNTDIDWACDDPTDCGQGMACCGTGTFVAGAPGCGSFASGFKGTHCAASCTASEITMCSSDAECGAKKCTPFATHSSDVGACE